MENRGRIRGISIDGHLITGKVGLETSPASLNLKCALTGAAVTCWSSGSIWACGELEGAGLPRLAGLSPKSVPPHTLPGRSVQKRARRGWGRERENWLSLILLPPSKQTKTSSQKHKARL